MNKITVYLNIILFTLVIMSCVTWEPAQPPMVRVELAHDDGSKI